MFGCTVPIFVDSARSGTSPIKIGRFVCQPFNAAVGAGDGGSDGLLDFVCQGRGHFPQRAHTIGMRQIGLKLSQFFTLWLGGFELRNVGRAAYEPFQISGARKDGMADSVDLLHFFIWEKNAVLKIIVGFFHDCPFDRVRPLKAILRVDPFESLFPSWRSLSRIEAVNPVPFLTSPGFALLPRTLESWVPIQGDRYLSVLKMSGSAFQLPPCCFFQTTTVLPGMIMGAPCASFS
jgi:hypothetical protein